MGKGKNFRWSKPMSHLLLEILADEAMKRNKSSNTFKASSFARVAKEISEKFGVDCHPKHVDNHLRTIKTTWNKIFKIRSNKSGFGWDDNLKMITCSKDTYNQEVKAFPDHEPFLNKKIEMYDEMAIVVGKDVATVCSAKSFTDIEAENHPVDLVENNPVELNVDSEDMSNRRHAASNSTSSESRSRKKRNRASAELDSNHVLIAENMNKPASNSTSSESRSRKKRNRASAELDSNYVLIAEKMDNIANAIKEMNAFSHVDKLYETVMKMEGFDEIMLAAAFDHLMANQTTARAFIKKSVNLRKVWLENFFNQHSGH